MLPILLIASLLLGRFPKCQGQATYQKEYRGNYKPRFYQTNFGFQITAPDTPYVAASGPDKLYFIDTRHDPETSQHIKDQIEWATNVRPDEYIQIDELEATAEVKNNKSGKTLFVFDPPYARVLFAEIMNKRNPDLQLPEHEPAGVWEVTYSHGPTLVSPQCGEYGCQTASDCMNHSSGLGRQCFKARVDNECGDPVTNELGSCGKVFQKAIDVPRERGESGASYYQRMDKLHWS